MTHGLDSSLGGTTSCMGTLSLIRFSWSSTEFEELELHGENKGGEDVKRPWDDEVILQSSMTRGPLATSIFLLE